MTTLGLTTGQAAKYLGRHPKTLQLWDRTGVLPAHRTKTNRRYWVKSELEGFLGKTSFNVPRKTLAYCRVSSQAQRPDLKNQRKLVENFCVASGRSDVEYIEEIGGGLNFNRPKFLTLVDSVQNGEISELIVVHKDRLSRFGFELLEHLCSTKNTKLTVINVESLSPEQEMVQDLMTIVHCFSSRLYELRNYKKAIKEALKS